MKNHHLTYFIIMDNNHLKRVTSVTKPSKCKTVNGLGCITRVLEMLYISFLCYMVCYTVAMRDLAAAFWDLTPENRLFP